MQQIEGTRMTAEDRLKLERNIKELERVIELNGGINDMQIKELRRLRRLR